MKTEKHDLTGSLYAILNMLAGLQEQIAQLAGAIHKEHGYDVEDFKKFTTEKHSKQIADSMLNLFFAYLREYEKEETDENHG